MHGHPRPEIRDLPADAIQNPPIVDEERHAAGMRALDRRQRRLEEEMVAKLMMSRNPYPDNRQGRRRWARELQKLAIHGAR